MDCTHELTIPYGAYAVVGYCTPFTDASSCLRLNLAATQDWVVEAAHKLERLKSLRPNWDSYGGLPLKLSAREVTFEALRALNHENLPTPAVVLGSAGTVQLEFRCHGKELELDLGDGNGMEYVKVDRGGKITEGREQGDVSGRLCELAGWFLRD